MMRRQNSNLGEQVILFLGECQLLILNSHHQIALAARTLLLRQDSILTYQSPNSLKDSKGVRPRQQSISLQRLTTHQHEYKISASMRAKLLLGRRDDGVQAYLRQLKVERTEKETSIVAVINQEENVINGFVFGKEAVALDFYESLNTAITTQIYLQKLPQSIPFNPKLVNLLAQTMNGRCIITPDNFCQGRQQEEQLRFAIDFLKSYDVEPLINFRGMLCEFQLCFRVTDDTSKDYAMSFLTIFPEKVQRLTIAGCELTSNMVGQLLSGAPPLLLADRLTRLVQLDLSRNSLTDDVFTTLTKLLKGCKRLQRVQLNGNSISFQKQAIIVGFLSSITNCRLSLLLATNAITSAKHITKYLINAEGPLPLSDLDLSFNPIIPQELAILTKAYLLKLKTPDFDFRLRLNQLQFQEPQAFEFLQEEYRTKKPNTMAIPVALSKHVMRRRGKQIGNSEQELKRSNNIEELFKNYTIQVFNGNFYQLKQIRNQLRSLGVQEDAIDAQTQKAKVQKDMQQQMLLRRVLNCLNLDVQSSQILSYFNETLRFCRRKGVQGTAFDFLAVVKGKIQAILQREAAEGRLGSTYRELLHSHKGRFKSQYQKIFREDYVFNINLPNLLGLSSKELIKQQKSVNQSQNITPFLIYNYLQAEPSQRPHLFVLEACLADPRLTSLKMARFQRDNIIQIFQKVRIGKHFLTLPQDRASLLSSYSIQTYNFSLSFIESGVSSSAFAGMMSRGAVEGDQEKVVLAFVEISKNFLKYLYYTPLELSDQTLMYLGSITNHLSSLQTQQEDTLKLILAEELFIHLITFFDSTRYKPLKPGLLTAICEFICRRVALGQSLLKRVAAYIIKTQGSNIDLHLHHVQGQFPWQGKIDWKVNQLQTLRRLVLGRGRVQVMVGDIAHPQLLVPFQLDELDSVLQLWQQVRKNVDKLNEFTNISQSNIDLYWLCAIRNDPQQAPIMLPSHQHIGKLLFSDGLSPKFYLRRVVFTPKQHSLEYLHRAKYQQLIAIYQQAREGLRLSSTLFLSSEDTLQAIVLTLCIDILLADELQLSELRKSTQEEAQGKYMLERERIVNECISRLYALYVPVGFSLDESARNKVIFQTKSSQLAAPKNINSNIRQSILTLIKMVGVAAFTTTLPSYNQKYTLFINNHQIIFVDRSKPQNSSVRAKFRNIIGFELAADGESPILKFQVIEQGEGKCQTMGIHRFSIQGDSIWIAQCFAIITQIAKNRLLYPPQLLFFNEDEQTCISECAVKGENSQLLSFPLLNLDSYLACTLSRTQDDPPPSVVAPPLAPVSALNESIPPKPSSDNRQKLQVSQKDNNNLLTVPEKVEGGTEIEEIIKSVQEGEEIVTSRRSSIGLRKDVPRRRSRNR